MNKAVQKIIISLCLIWVPYSGFAAIQAALTPKPNPPDVGDNTLEILLTDEKNQPIENAVLDLIVSMPAMGSMPHMEEKAIIKPVAQGRYLAEYAISMGGSWEVSLTIKKDSLTETLNYSLTTQIPGLVDKNIKRSSTTEMSRVASSPTISVGPDRMQKIGVRFSQAKHAPLQKHLRAVGVVEADPTKKTDVVLRFQGYVEKQFKVKIGDYIEKGTPLIKVYSPELTTAQNEFFLTHNDSSHNLHRITLDRLKNLGLSDKDISGIKSLGKPEREVTITAPEAGTITEINIREGSSFAKNQTLYSIGNLSQNYIVARIFQKDLPYLKVGQNVEISLPGFGESSYEGKIDLVYPNFKEGEGTASVRVITKAESSYLIPGIYVDLDFPIDFGTRLVIPVTAILHSGRHQYVFVERGEGILEPTEIVTGFTNDEWTEVVEGLKEGDLVAASGTFLLSSEAQLRSALPKWEAKK